MPDEASAPSDASFFARTAAFLLDWAIVLIIAMFIASATAPDDRARVLIALVTLSTYHIVCLVALSTTPGKMALRLHVAGIDGRRLEPDRAILRFLVFFLTIPILPINAAVLVLDPQHRTLHDRIARTRVLYGRPHYETP